MPLLPGAEPFRHDGGQIGVLVSHGFTGSPQSVRPWADHLAARGYTVSLPLLPGHGTRWQDLAVTGWQDWYAEVERELRTLTERCERVFVCGLSMGGALALRLAAQHGAAISGLALVNPANKIHDPLAVALPVMRHLVPSVKGIASDIAKPGSHELGYDRTPLHAVYSLRRFLRLVDAELPQVTQPLLVMHSAQDHVVPPADSERILSQVSSRDTTERLLERSYHVATLDYDAEFIFDETVAFITRLTAGMGEDTGTGTGREGAAASG
ncbi:alpha/beta fold hydrolase [Streptomyces sp. HD1123-B1]|uniref:alpha/beta hydrolase n=1 Tax=Streptomyces TaxID=1883 RepID=UPI0020C867B2|nr:alpha/beta fold hydrolase [Streptomyces sp. NEAU-Y11]MCP9208447.1 alpha/beta fold hydrolase [Streptomyces sp. NEAU-Y11]